MSYPGLLYFFDEKVKPIMLRGTRLLNPAPTGVCRYGVSAVREGDVNFWFYTKGDTTIAIDSGHIDRKGTDEAFRKIGIDPGRIRHLLLTHADVDHCGGVDAKAGTYLFPNAEIYIGKGEVRYLERTLHRQTKLGKKIYNCVTLRDGYHTLEDEDELLFGDIRVRCLETPGHTIGHMCYLVDDTVLFSGDSIAINGEGGWAFWDFFCQYPDMNKESLVKLEKRLEGTDLKCVCTGHSGISYDVEHLFAHTDESALFSRTEAFDPDAPKNVCRD